MDQMDIDHTVDVPDTPDRLKTRGINRRSGCIEENQCQSTPPNSLSIKYLEDGTRDEPMVIDSGSKEPSLRPPKFTSSSSNSRYPINPPSFSSSSSSSRKVHLFRRGVKEKNPTFLGHDSIHARSERPLIISRSPSSQDGNLQKPVIGKRSEIVNGASSLHRPPIFEPTSRNASEETESVRKVGSRAGFGEGMKNLDGIQHKNGNGGSISVDHISAPRIIKQKRLVRNGCISPNNIAKSKQLTGKEVDGSVAFGHNNNGSATFNAPTVSIDVRELVAEDSDSHKRKGKGVIGHPSFSKGPDFNMNSQGRSSMTSIQNAMDTSDRIESAGKSIEESGGWRSTRDRSKEINISSPNNGRERKEKGISVATNHTLPNDPIASEHLIPQPSRESVFHPNARLGQLKAPRSAADTIKRQKQGSTLGSSGECSTSVAHDPKVVFLCSSEAATSKSTLNSVENLQPVIEVDEFSPELKHNAHEENVRARQLEEDERLARELQEQLYNEMPDFGVGQVDEHIALSLQHQEGLTRRSSRTRHPGLDARGFMPNLHRQTHSRSSSNGPRRGSLSRASTLGRMARMRSRFPGQPRTILPSRGRTSLFPADMDVEMRMHILGAFEEFSELGVSPGILQAERDFNENDYEMLLALDENNDHHGGASVHQINGLPQSTVQCDNFEESCAICLDTPTMGDTIRHLPCLHKFHKDCIDPWLMRKSSCPVCKSSIT